MGRKSKPGGEQPRVTIDGDVARQIRQHARSCQKTEVCGVLIGNDSNGSLSIDACIAGLNAAQAGTHVTFTQDTWEHIYRTKDSKYPEERIVGWYHSHPGFGVFLSDHDTFIHKNFFSSPLQVAWVYDPLSDEEGCFGWVGSRLERLSEVAVTDRKGGEGAGETGKPEPIGMQEEDEQEREESTHRSSQGDDDPLWLRITTTAFTYLLVLVIGFMVSWVLFPRKTVYVVDPRTGFVYQPSTDGRHLELVPDVRVTPDMQAFPADSSTPAGKAGPDDPKGSDIGDKKAGSDKEKNAPR
jgi:proteasome lid subunit RPN8/RPN11